jgi:transposase
LAFQDEAVFGRINKTGAAWAPKHIRPIVKAQKVRQFLYAFSAVFPHSGENFSLILPVATAEAMDLFLKHLSEQHKDSRCIIITDQAPWHSKKLHTKYDNIRIIELPPYSPELNPTEHFWDHIRENFFKNQCFSSIDHVQDRLVEAFESASNDKATIQSLSLFSWIPLNFC